MATMDRKYGAKVWLVVNKAKIWVFSPHVSIYIWLPITTEMVWSKDGIKTTRVEGCMINVVVVGLKRREVEFRAI